MHCFSKGHWKTVRNDVWLRYDWVSRLRALGVSVACLWVAMLPAGNLTAQLVQIGPGYVKAPFVRVYSFGDGSTHVRAPFVSVNSPAPYYGVPRYRGYATPQYAAPQYADETLQMSRPGIDSSSYGDLDWLQLRQSARESLDRLQKNLGGSWQDYLSIDRLAPIVEDRTNEPLDEPQVEQLKEILGNFTATLNSRNYQNVTNTAGFRELYGSLVELSLSPQQRNMRQLAMAKRQLDDDLARINAPGSWRDYLHLPIAVDSEASDIPEAPNVDDNITRLEATLRRYDQIAADEQFRMIAELAGFQSTRLRLREYFELLQESPSQSVLRSVEQLPLPEPNDADLNPPANPDSRDSPANLDSLEPVPEPLPE